MIDDSLDPRARRTRAMLQNSLAELMKTKSFERISVAEIADGAMLNRATFYDHYGDKFALLDEVVAARFHALMSGRGVTFDGSCKSALPATILAICDYIEANSQGGPEVGGMQPFLEAAIIKVVTRTFLAGMRRGTPEESRTAEMVATAASWLLYGTAKDWLSRSDRCAAKHAVPALAALVLPVLMQAPWRESHNTLSIE